MEVLKARRVPDRSNSFMTISRYNSATVSRARWARCIRTPGVESGALTPRRLAEQLKHKVHSCRYEDFNSRHDAADDLGDRRFHE
jgi:hypothetical protein